MFLTVAELVKTLRSSVNIQMGDNTDSAFLTMSDEDIILYLKLATTGVYPEITSLNDLPDGGEYPVVLLAKKELYLKLAVLKTDKVDLTADNNNQIKQSQRFGYYMNLAKEAQTEYSNWVVSSSSYPTGGVTTYTTLLSKNHYSNINYEKGPVPIVKVKITNIESDTIEFGWSVENTDHFGCYKVYISSSQIVDMYRDGSRASDKIMDNAELIKSTSDIRDNFHRISGLTPNTPYHIAVFSIERNQLFGYVDSLVTTLEELVVEDINISSI